MEKPETDYSNTIIYKIACKDSSIKDIYVGHTVNFVQRKHAHRQSCTNKKSTNYNCKLYETIRSNGGWSNWTMDIIHFFNCKDKYEARKKEQEYFELLNATLNSIEPCAKPKDVEPKNIVVKKIISKKDKPIKNEKLYNKRVCHKCVFECNSKNDWIQHIMSDAHKNKIPTANMPKNTKEEYICEICSFTCSKPSDYSRHLSTSKHKRLSTTKEIVKTSHRICACGEKYMHKSSLSRHKKTCTYIQKNEPPAKDTPAKDTSANGQTQWVEIVKLLIKENQDICNLVITQHNTLADQHKTIVDQHKTLVEQNKCIIEVVNHNAIPPLQSNDS